MNQDEGRPDWRDDGEAAHEQKLLYQQQEGRDKVNRNANDTLTNLDRRFDDEFENTADQRIKV